MELFKQGAEAKLYKSQLFGRNIMIKERFSKKYRHPQLDKKLTRKRTLQEVRAMLKCRKAGIKTPLPYFVNYLSHEIFMEEIVNSITLREEVDALLQLQDIGKDRLRYIAAEIGLVVAKMHMINVVHGDLTTSNILIVKENDEDIVGDKSYILTFTLIDFGLSCTSDLYEDFGVDLYVLEKALLSTHPNTEWVFQLILDSYLHNISDVKKREETLSKLEEIRMRGRKRVMIG